MTTTTLNGNQILLVPYRADDRSEFVKLVTDDEVMKFVDGTLSDDFANTLFDSFIGAKAGNEDDVWAIRSIPDLTYLGHAALVKDKSGDVEILFYVCKEHWRKGIALEAGVLMRNYALIGGRYGSVFATIDWNHVGSRRVVEKLGFKNEGLQKDEDGVDFHLFRLSSL
ncbi:MAG: GNAT family N-acetyltransferase [Pseudobdellovibrionaceae bacterium]